MVVLVASCAAYADAWVPFMALWRRHYTSCPYKALIVTDHGEETDGTFVVGEDRGWCANLRAALASVRDENVLLLQEDFFLTADVDAAAIASADAYVTSHADVGCLRLYPCPGPLQESVVDYIEGHSIGEVHRGEPYRISCQVAVWRKAYLDRVLSVGTSAASFELSGTERSADWPERVLSVHRSDPAWPIMYLCSAISRGKWSRDALRLCAEHGIRIRGNREVEP